jgi:anti-sigma regulatory factor (Ser/Thr protein kinase)
MEESSVDPKNSVRFDLAPELGEIRRMVEAIEVFGERHGFPGAALYQVTLVLDELITNIVSHGIEPGESRPITVELNFADGVLTITLSDPGRPFDPRTVPEPDVQASLKDRKIGGLGLHFVRTIMDSIDYRYESGRNYITLMKRVERTPG